MDNDTRITLEVNKKTGEATLVLSQYDYDTDEGRFMSKIRTVTKRVFRPSGWRRLVSWL